MHSLGKKNWVLVAHKTQTRHPIDKFVSNFKEEGVVFFFKYVKMHFFLEICLKKFIRKNFFFINNFLSEIQIFLDANTE
jgi:hypothetical protein